MRMRITSELYGNGIFRVGRYAKALRCVAEPSAMKEWM